MRKSAQIAKIFGTPPERGHSCPQQLPNAQQDQNVRELYFRSTLLRTRMSALRSGSGYAGLGTARPTAPPLVRRYSSGHQEPGSECIYARRRWWFVPDVSLESRTLTYCWISFPEARWWWQLAVAFLWAGVVWSAAQRAFPAAIRALDRVSGTELRDRYRRAAAGRWP